MHSALDYQGGLHRTVWGQMPGGEDIHLFTLTRQGGVQVQLSNLGATLVRLRVPDRAGNPGEVVLGHDRPEPYLNRAQSPYFGATVGRYANRIAQGRFTLDSTEYTLPLNDGPNTLHGGPAGFDMRLWEAEERSSPDGPSVTFTRLSPDGEQGFPGNLRVSVTYTLLPGHVLRLDYRADTDAPTVVNLTNHPYWNLSGGQSPDIRAHQVTVPADHFTPSHPGGLPTGEVRKVQGTPFDLRVTQTLGPLLSIGDEQMTLVGGGFDHNFILRGSGMKLAATLYDPASGRELQITTTEPGVQVYTGNALDGSIDGRDGQRYGKHAALCLETQHFPDAPNHPHFPSTRLDPGRIIQSRTEYAFRVR